MGAPFHNSNVVEINPNTSLIKLRFIGCPSAANREA